MAVRGAALCMQQDGSDLQVIKSKASKKLPPCQLLVI